MNATTLTPSINKPAPQKPFRFMLLAGIIIGAILTMATLFLLKEEDQVVRQNQSAVQSIVPVYPQNHRLDFYRPNGAVTLYLLVEAEALSQREEAKRTRDVLEVALAEVGWITYRPYSDVKVGNAYFKMKMAEHDPERNRFHLKVTIESDGRRKVYGEYRFDTMAPGLGAPVLDTAHASEEPLGYRDGGDITNRAALVLQVLEELREARSQQSLKRGKLY
ncbi:MAG: hypothetical protein WAT81_02130 [Candidatus Moraniibacteriota bacterium]